MSTSMPSSLANGRYELGQLIGRGGMAEVHVALDTRLGRTVAVKIMRADFADDDVFLKRFQREAHAVAQMSNPNIVNIFDSGDELITLPNGTTEHLPYIVMEYVKGQTLRDIIKINGPLAQRDAEQVMLGVLNALDYSHRMGVIHRDIKPGNIMISEQGEVKVMDFGIARALDDSAATMTQSQGVVGTAQYLSPEQARGETVDTRSDIYSAGCVLYEMLTGRPPFTGDSAVAIAYQHVSETAVPPSTIVPGLPEIWDSICAKAMAKDRQNRYASAADFKNDLLTLMSGGIPTAAAFNPLTDLMGSRTTTMPPATTPLAPVTTDGATQVYNPSTGQFEMIPATTTGTIAPSRAEQRQAAEKAKRKKIIIGSIIAAVVVILAVVAIAFSMNRTKVEMVTVPTFNSTTTEARARAELEKVGLKIVVETDTNSSLAEGTFTKQNPAGGTSVEKGSSVTVWFSAGPSSVEVPDVTGYSQDDARSTLENAGFKVSATVKTEDSATVAKDKVTRTDPAAGSTQKEGTSIILYVSSGMTKVPTDLVGQSKDTVVSQLQSAGLSVTIESEPSDSVASGSVTRLSPDGGTSVEQGSNVTIWVSTGKEQVTVPNVVGMTYKDAKEALESVGLTVTSSGSSDTTGTVTSSNPASGSSVDKGSSVTLTVQAATTPSPSASASSSESADSNSTGSNGNTGNN